MLKLRFRSSLATGDAAARVVVVVLLVLVGEVLVLSTTRTSAFLPPATAINTCHRARQPTKPAAAATQSRRGCGASVPRRKKDVDGSLLRVSFELEGEEDNVLPTTNLDLTEGRSQSEFGSSLYDCLQGDSLSALRLAIFPLRKSVRLPTETLTLNLYERRYLALAEHVLQLPERSQHHHVEGNKAIDTDGATSTSSASSSTLPSAPTPALADTRGLFGAMYAGSCPQIVPANRQSGGGAAPALPVTPLVQPGDVGVIFGVESFQDGNVPTLGSVPRRRIRIVARGLARFRVGRVIENGYGCNSATPYIVVEAHVLKDAPLPSFSSDEAEFERRMRSASVKLFGMSPDDYLVSNQLVSSSLSGSESKSGATEGTTRARELASFAIASRAMELAGTAEDVAARTALLRLDSPLERLRRRVPSNWYSGYHLHNFFAGADSIRFKYRTYKHDRETDYRYRLRDLSPELDVMARCVVGNTTSSPPNAGENDEFLAYVPGGLLVLEPPYPTSIYFHDEEYRRARHEFVASLVREDDEEWFQQNPIGPGQVPDPAS